MPTKAAKHAAVIDAFGQIPIDDADNLDWLYRRRHLAKVDDGKWRDLKYVAEIDELEQIIWKTLDRIRQRDGAKIANEAAEWLADSITA